MAGRRPALLEAWAKTLRRRGDELAVVQASDGTTATFRELDARSAAWCEKHVTDTNRLKGRAVVFAAPNGIGWLEIFLGLLKCGAVVTPLDSGEPLQAQRQLAVALRAAAWWSGSSLQPLESARRYRDPNICLIKLTSGTTGRPRPLVFTAAQMLADGAQVTATMGIRARELNYALIPLGHSYGLGNLTMPLLAQGVPLVCGSAPLPQAIAADFARWKPTVFPGVPAMWRAIAASDITLPGLRLGISAGAPLPPEVAREFAARFGRRLHSFYGSSETGGITYDKSGAGALGGTVGRALRGVKLHALPGGRLRVSSAAVVTHGNKHRVGRHGAWIMPDRTALDARGELTILSRLGSTVKLAGRRVSLTEISDRLRRLPRVRDAWAGIAPGREPVLAAVVATDRPPAELRGELLADTAAWKIPRRLIVVAGLPMNARGKTDTRALKALIA
ncbi:MAG TPA: class I adenylate-forming enzyme family protein [Opitutaceae bacterium]|nr:class I adenylate-forming enzyme family protein [Opitutaceae bacterium]